MGTYCDIETSKVLLAYGVAIMNNIIITIGSSCAKKNISKEVLLPGFKALLTATGILQAVASEETVAETAGPDLQNGTFPGFCADQCLALAQEITVMRAMQGNMQSGAISSYCINTSKRYQRLKDQIANISDIAEDWKKVWSIYLDFK